MLGAARTVVPSVALIGQLPPYGRCRDRLPSLLYPAALETAAVALPAAEPLRRFSAGACRGVRRRRQCWPWQPVGPGARTVCRVQQSARQAAGRDLSVVRGSGAAPPPCTERASTVHTAPSPSDRGDASRAERTGGGAGSLITAPLWLGGGWRTSSLPVDQLAPAVLLRCRRSLTIQRGLYACEGRLISAFGSTATG